MAKTTLYLYRASDRDFVESLKGLESAKKITFKCFTNSSELATMNLGNVDHLVVSGSFSTIKRVLALSVRTGLSVGIVPLDSQGDLSKMFDLRKKSKDAFERAIVPAEKSIDLLYCNDVIVLSDVRIGETSIIKEFEFDYINESIFKRVGLFWHARKDKKKLRHHKFNIQTEKDDIKEFSAVGMVAFEHGNGSWISSVFGRHLGANDGNHVLAVLAPTSLFEYFIIQPVMLLFGRSNQNIPSSLGYVRSDKIIVSSSQQQSVLIDDIQSLQTPVELSTKSRILKLGVGDNYWNKGKAVKSDRSSIKLDNVPRDEESMDYLSKGLPMFKHASKEMYATLFKSLREDSLFSIVFLVMLILSTLIATFGLFINSSSVIIGAMLIAPLMQPIVSLGMGALRRDLTLQLNSAKSIFIGVLAVVVTSMLVAWAVPIDKLTSEMAGRLSPSILDLFVAIVSGVAAAYAKNNEKILGSLAGVSIAVALVPPIAVAGIGLGWADWSMFASAFLLFLTNLVGIVFAVAVTFMILGYSPIKVAKKGIVVWMLAMILVSIPLYSSFVKMQQSAKIQSTLTNLSFEIDNNRVKLAHIELIERAKKMDIRCEIIVSKPLNSKQKDYVKDLILKSTGVDANVIATFRYRL